MVYTAWALGLGYLFNFKEFLDILDSVYEARKKIIFSQIASL